MGGLYSDLSETIDKMENDPKQDVEDIKKTLKSIQNRTEEMLSSVLSIEDRIDTITRALLNLMLDKEIKDAGSEGSRDKG